MSVPKRNREGMIDVTALVLGAAIVVLATFDLVVWASMRNAPNQISKFITEQTAWLDPPVSHAAR